MIRSQLSAIASIKAFTCAATDDLHHAPLTREKHMSSVIASGIWHAPGLGKQVLLRNVQQTVTTIQLCQCISHIANFSSAGWGERGVHGQEACNNAHFCNGLHQTGHVSRVYKACSKIQQQPFVMSTTACYAFATLPPLADKHISEMSGCVLCWLCIATKLRFRCLRAHTPTKNNVSSNTS
jgi:hypothetical protein